jgi:electron transfer flavoprotein beta subunit
MKIVVLVKVVPDTYGDRRLDLETGLLVRDAERVLDEIGERALEVALRHADSAADTEVTVISMGPESSQAELRKVLSVGAGSAVQVLDPLLIGADLTVTAAVLAAAIRRGEFDLVLTGNSSTDGGAGILPAMLAETLALPLVAGVGAVELSASSVSGVRTTDSGEERVSASLPAVLSITEASPAVRYPDFKGIMAAKKKPFEVIALADLDVDIDPASLPQAVMTEVSERPARESGVKIVDEGDAGTRLAEYLVQNHLIASS